MRDSPDSTAADTLPPTPLALLREPGAERVLLDPELDGFDSCLHGFSLEGPQGMGDLAFLYDPLEKHVVEALLPKRHISIDSEVASGGFRRVFPFKRESGLEEEMLGGGAEREDEADQVDFHIDRRVSCY